MKSEEIKELFKQFESIVCEYNKVGKRLGDAIFSILIFPFSFAS